MMDKVKDLQQRVSILESTVKRLKNIATMSAQYVQDAQYNRHYYQCGNDITDMNEICGTPDCPNELFKE